jgi:hypothetical protein
MKTILFSVLLLFASLLTKAQVWAPSGATWHYDWIEMAVDGYIKIQYINDSVVGGKLCKILQVERHTYNWTTQSYYNGVLGYEFTYYENNIVYYYRYGQFFTLYDFNSIGGSSWEVAGWEQNPPCDSTGLINVDSAGMTTINAFPLKYLKTSPGLNSNWEFYDKIIERIGSLGYMFPGPNCAIDIPGPGQLRCYYDDAFGLYQRSGFPPACDYIIGVDNKIPEGNLIKIYPVPASTFLTIEIDDRIQGKMTIELSDVYGKKIRHFETDQAKLVIRINEIGNGIYFIKATNQSGLIYTQKVIKADL